MRGLNHERESMTADSNSIADNIDSVQQQIDECWEFVVNHQAQLQAIVEVGCKGRYDLVDDLWAVCVIDRVQRIFNTYDAFHESGASLKTHMFTSIRFYIHKYMNKQAMGKVKGGKFEEQLIWKNRERETATKATVEIDLETRELVQYVLDRLPAHDARLLKMYHWDGMTFQEMSDVLGFNAKGSARLHYIAALKRATTIVENCR